MRWKYKTVARCDFHTQLLVAIILEKLVGSRKPVQLPGSYNDMQKVLRCLTPGKALYLLPEQMKWMPIIQKLP